MGTPLDPKYIPYTYIDPLGYARLGGLPVASTQIWRHFSAESPWLGHVPIFQDRTHSSSPILGIRFWWS